MVLSLRGSDAPAPRLRPRPLRPRDAAASHRAARRHLRRSSPESPLHVSVHLRPCRAPTSSHARPSRPRAHVASPRPAPRRTHRPPRAPSSRPSPSSSAQPWAAWPAWAAAWASSRRTPRGGAWRKTPPGHLECLNLVGLVFGNVFHQVLPNSLLSLLFSSFLLVYVHIY